MPNYKHVNSIFGIIVVEINVEFQLTILLLLLSNVWWTKTDTALFWGEKKPNNNPTMCYQLPSPIVTSDFKDQLTHMRNFQTCTLYG